MDDIENESYSSKSVPFPSDDEGRTIAEDSKASDMEETVDNSDGDVPAEVKQEPRVTVRSAITLGILVFINLLNYMDRYTLAGIEIVSFSVVYPSILEISTMQTLTTTLAEYVELI